MIVSLLRAVSHALVPVLVVTLTAAPMPTFAAGPAAKNEAKSKPPEAAQAAPQQVSGTIALLRFTGDPPASDIREAAQNEFEEQGFTVRSVALDAQAAAAKVKCRGKDLNDDCLSTIGKWLNKNPKTAAEFIVYGGVTTEGAVKRATVVMYDVGKNKRVDQYAATITSDDYIVPLTLPRAMAQDLAAHVVPPPPPTEEEQRLIAELDEPEKTPEELAAERRKLEEAESRAGQIGAEEIDVTGVEYDLKKDFKDFCRTGPRRKRESKQDPPDLRPKCSRGPFWGYWQPRAWVALSLTVGAAAATLGLYSVALARRLGPYQDAVDAVEAFEAEVGGDPSQNPMFGEHDGVMYSTLASEVSKEASEMQKFAIAGDAMLGVSVLLAGVLGIIIWQDRHSAKDQLTEEKRLRAISNVRLAPFAGRGSAGAAFGFSF